MSEIANTIFSPEMAARFDKLVTIYPLKRSALVPMLLYAQDEVGYVSDAVVSEIARRLNQLYDYMLAQLIDANVKQADAPLAEVLGLLETVGEAWNSSRPAPIDPSFAPHGSLPMPLSCGSEPN